MFILKKGFTLAEILIALMIIGIIAMLVVPGMISSTTETEYNSGIKKAYANLSQAIKMIQVNNSGVVNVGTDDSPLLRNDFCNVMSCAKIGTAQDILGPTDYKFYKGEFWGWPSTDATCAAAELNNGNLVCFYNYNNCTGNGYFPNACGDVEIDINGKKGPNMIGKDLFDFWIMRQGENKGYIIVPVGVQGDTFAGLPNGCTSGSTSITTSAGCAAKRLLDPDNMP